MLTVVGGTAIGKNQTFFTYRAKLAVDSFLQLYNRAKIKTENEDEKIFCKFFSVF